MEAGLLFGEFTVRFKNLGTHPGRFIISFLFFHFPEPRHPSWLLESSDPVEEKRAARHPVDPLQSSLFNINYQVMHGPHVCRSPAKIFGDHESLPYVQNYRCCIQHQLSNQVGLTSSHLGQSTEWLLQAKNISDVVLQAAQPQHLGRLQGNLLTGIEPLNCWLPLRQTLGHRFSCSPRASPAPEHNFKINL